MSIKLVFADDSVTMQKVVQLTLDSEDIDLRIVSNGEEAVAALEEEKPDIVVADVSIPGINGFELCKQIKSSPETGKIPVILISGELEAYDENLGRSAGADAHISKPFKSGEFIEAVKKLAAKDFNMAGKTELVENSASQPSAVAEEKSSEKTAPTAEKPEIPVMLELDPEKNIDEVTQEVDGEMDEEFEIVEDGLDIEDDLDDEEDEEDAIVEDDVEIEEAGLEKEEAPSGEKSETALPPEPANQAEGELEEIPDEAEKILDDVFKDEFDPSAVLDETPHDDDKKTAPSVPEKTSETTAKRNASKGMDELFRDSIEQAVHNFLENEAGGILKEVLAESVDRHINNVFKTQLETVIREEISKAIGESFQSSMPELLGMIEKITSHITPRIAEEMIKIAIEQIRKGDR